MVHIVHSEELPHCPEGLICRMDTRVRSTSFFHRRDNYLPKKLVILGFKHSGHRPSVAKR